MNKKIKKIIVNGLTLTRVIATISMPVLYNFLTASTFLLIIGGVLLTDALDGFFARKWEVSTIFGSLFDMGADKVLGVSVLMILSFSYPVMLIPLMLEIFITYINNKSMSKGSIGASSQIGRVKTWLIGLSMFSLMLIGATPELSKCISNVKIDSNFFLQISSLFKNKFNIDSNILSNLDNILNNIKENFINILKHILDFIKDNKKIIEDITIPSAIISESIAAADYLNKYTKVKNNETQFSIDDLKKYKEYIKSIWLDEEYYKKTKDMHLYEKLTPPDERKEKIKKLTLESNKSVDK